MIKISKFLCLYILLFINFIKESNGWCQLQTFQEPSGIFCVDYSKDGRFLLTTTSTHTTIWKVSTKQIYKQFPITNCHCAKFSDNVPTTRVAISSRSRIYVYDLADPFPQITSNWNPSQGTSFMYIDYDGDDRVLTCCQSSNRIKVWNVNNDPPTTYKDFVSSNAITCSFAPNGKIGVSTSNQKLRYYEADGSFKWQLGNKQVCVDIAFSAGSDKMIAACDDTDQYGVLINDLEGSQNIYDILRSGDKLYTASYSPDGEHYIFGGQQKILHIYNASNNKVESKFITSGQIRGSDFDQEGQYLAVGCDDGKIYIYAKYCLGCDPGYFYNSASQLCEDCWSSMHGCGSCTDANTCVECIQGYTLNSGTNKCDDCKLNINGCGSCLDADNCTYCLAGYYLDTQQSNYDCERCQDRMIGCYQCEDEFVCLQCQSDYFLDSATDKCLTCSNVNQHCIKCNSSTYCSECQIGFYQNSGSCSPCNTNCYACQSNTNCTDCFQGYYPKTVGGNIICQQCDYGCLACNATGHCTDCFDQRFLTAGGDCNLCNYPCSTCNDSATACLSCVSGYYITGTTCSQCSYPCITCNDSTSCLSCPPTYYLFNQTCQVCAQNYGNCSLCDDTQCFVCNLGFYIDTGVSPKVCVSCLQDMHGCISCNSSTNCLVCAGGYYNSGNINDGNSSCIICPVGCSACYTSSNCTNCHHGYFLNTGTDTCDLCQDTCIRCTSASDCLQCQLGYYLAGTSCLSCQNIDNYCLTCAYDVILSSNICTSCQIGMFYDNVNDKCQFCDQQCTACIDSANCTSCVIGKYLDTQLDDCLPCHHNCSECFSETYCMSCNAGYYLTSLNACESCQTINCATCNSTTQDCLSCNIGFFIDISTNPISCKICLLQISRCQVCTSSTNCQLCSYGYALAADHLSCTPCSDIEGCKHCLISTSCENCDIGYYLVPDGSGNDICTKCSDGCKHCDNSGVCQECYIQYFLVTPGNTCSFCNDLIDGCIECTDSTICIYCQTGYYLNETTSQCQLCSNSIFGCVYCDDNMTCIHCFDGYYLNSINNQCQPCDNSLYGCNMCNSSSICLSCEYGMYLDNNQCYLCQTNLANCQFCSDSSTCKFCKSGSFLNGIVCAVCQAHIPGCILCNSGSECVQCQGGYYLDTSTDLCQPCLQQGCQICLQSDLNKCVTCNSKFYLNSSQQNCILCRSTLPGCMKCANSLTCQVCDVGFFVNSTDDCQLCSDRLTGCGRCQSDSVCLQCKSSFYLLSDNTCEQCKLSIPGCLYCLNSTQCLTCWHGYYLEISDNLCYSCTEIEGCNSCLNKTHCLYCETHYFLQQKDNLCYPCSAIEGCYACVSNSTCSICSGGYILNNNQLCSKMRVESYKQVEQMKLISLYVDEKTLKHQLYAKGMYYDQSIELSQINWSKTTNLVVQDKTYEQIDLQIQQVKWGQQSKNLLIFITNNPLNIQKNTYNLTRKRMLTQGSLPDDLKIHMKMQQQTINKILPDFFHDQDLVMDYDIDSPEFAKSYIESTGQLLDITYSAFGIILTIILLVIYLIKALYTVPYSYQMGGIMPHVFANKVPALIIHPTFVQFVSFCYGFMTADLPWANQSLGEVFGDPTDKIPPSYLFLYANLNIGSTYFISMIVIIVLGILLYVYYKSRQEQFVRKYPLGEVFLNFFIFGLAFAGSICIIGALQNQIQEVNQNSVFYIAGIAIYSIALGVLTFKMIQSRHNFSFIRVFIKASLFGLATFSLIYIFFAAIFVDLVCMIIQYCIGQKYHNKYPKIWVLKNLLLNLSISVMVIDPQIKLSIIIASILIGVAVILDIVTHIKEYKNQEKDQIQFVQSSQKDEDINIWNINFNNDEKPSKFIKDQFQGTKTTFHNTKNSNFGSQYVARRNKFKRNKNQPKPDILHVIEKKEQQPQKIDQVYMFD